MEDIKEKVTKEEHIGQEIVSQASKDNMPVPDAFTPKDE